MGIDYFCNAEDNLWSELTSFWNKYSGRKQVMSVRSDFEELKERVLNYKILLQKYSEQKHTHTVLFNRYKRAIIKFDVEDFEVDYTDLKKKQHLLKEQIIELHTSLKNQIQHISKEFKTPKWVQKEVFDSEKIDLYLQQFEEQYKEYFLSQKWVINNDYVNTMNNILNPFYDYLEDQRQQWRKEVEIAEENGTYAQNADEYDQWIRDVDDTQNFLDTRVYMIQEAFEHNDVESLNEAYSDLRNTVRPIFDLRYIDANDFKSLSNEAFEIKNRYENLFRSLNRVRDEDIENKVTFLNKLGINTQRLLKHEKYQEIVDDNIKQNEFEALKHELLAMNDSEKFFNRILDSDLLAELEDDADQGLEFIKTYKNIESEIEEDSSNLTEEELKHIEILKEEISDVTFNKALSNGFEQMKDFISKSKNLTDKLGIESFTVDEEFLSLHKSLNAGRMDTTEALKIVIQQLNTVSGVGAIMPLLKNTIDSMKLLRRSIRDGYGIKSLNARLSEIEARNEMMCVIARQRYPFLGGIPDNTKNKGRTHGHHPGEYSVYG